MEASFYPILCWSPKKKKKVLRLSSATFLCDFYDIPERGAVNRSCLRFLAGNKNASFWREKKRWNSQSFSAKMPEKISHFFGLIGNTDHINTGGQITAQKQWNCSRPTSLKISLKKYWNYCSRYFSENVLSRYCNYKLLWMKHSVEMTVVCVNFFHKAVWEKMLDLAYDSNTIMIHICNDQMKAFIMLPLRHG